MPNQQTNQTPKTIREPLAWLFVAEYADGSTISQDAADTCTTRTDGTGSAFTDVLEREKDVRLAAFHLYHLDGKQAASVDLITGAFIVNGTPVHVHDQYFDPTRHKLRLVYFRENKIDNEVTATVQADGSVTQQSSATARHYVNRYFIGWQTTVGGKNKQVTLAVG